MKFQSWRISTLIVSLALLLCASSQCRAGLFDDSRGGQKLGPGKEIRIQDPDVGGLRYYSVYLPTDYDGHRPFPMIISFHAAKQEPATWPFVAITGGKGFIVVGMEYQADALPKSTGAGETDPWKSSVDTLRRIAARLRSDLKVDPRVIFIGGVGRGALQAQILASKSAELWAGVVILRAADAPEDAPVKSLAGKPILVAIPTVDPQAAAAKAAADDYKKAGADVTFKSLDSKKNEINTSDPALKEWLMTYGPVKVVHDAVVTGQAAEKANRLGDAFTAYDSVATSDSPSPETKVARDSARRIADKANAILAGVDRSLAAKDAASAARALIDMQSRYAGSDFGVKAAEKLKSISSEPAVVKMYAQMKLDADADALEAQALAFERSQDFLRAMTTYDAYLTKYPTSHRAAAVKARLAALHADKSIQAKQAETDCKSWLSLADNFIRSGLPDKARPQLQKIIDAYGDTTWAEQARARLKQLDSM